MEFEFNTELEDGSQFEIAKVLLNCHQLFASGKKNELLTFLGHAPIAQISQCEKTQDPNKPANDDSCSSDSGDEMEVESENSEQNISYNLRSKCAVTPSINTNLPTVPENVSTSEMTSSQQDSSSPAQTSLPSSSQMEIEEEDGWTAVSNKKRISKRTQNKNTGS